MEAFSFRPSADVAALLAALLDIYERRDPGRPAHRTIRVKLDGLALPAYHSQVEPASRQTANEQLQAMASAGYVRLAWLPGEEGQLLESVALVPEKAGALFPWLDRNPVAAQRAALRDLLLGDRFRLPDGDWRRSAVDHTLAQLQAGRSPAPFTLNDPAFNRDLLAALVALAQVAEETPYRVFSVRVFNDSKIFEMLKGAVAVLARRHGWPQLTDEEALREVGLVANPAHIFMYGPWRLEEADGHSLSLAHFSPAVGVPALMAGRLRRVEIGQGTNRVICVENLASFYELVRYEGQGLAALCLLGNPAPSTRYLLRRLAERLPADIPLLAWPDLDYGGLNILAQLRRSVSPRFMPYRLDVETLESHVRWARPLTETDRRLLARLQGHAELADVQPVITHMLARGLKLEQEAVWLDRTHTNFV